MNNKISIGYLTETNPCNKLSWSGTHFFIMKALQEYCGDVIILGPIHNSFFFIGKIINKLSLFFFKKKFLYHHWTCASKNYAKKIEKKLKSYDIDIIFAPAGSQLIAYLETTIPIIYYSDATFHSMINYYPDFSNILQISKEMGNKIEKMAIDKSIKVIYASEWAFNSAIRDYNCLMKNTLIIPFGANIEKPPDKNEILALREIKTEICKLLFVGVNWDRKGGKIAFDTMIELNKRGIKTELHIVGCHPPKEITHDKMIVHGFLNKNIKEQSLKIENLYKDSTFFIFPSKNECAGIVNAEAKAYALPVIAYNTGGVSTYVKDQETGVLISISADANVFCNVIMEIFRDKEYYMRLCKNAVESFHNSYNWNSWGKSFKNLLDNLH